MDIEMWWKLGDRGISLPLLERIGNNFRGNSITKKGLVLNGLQTGRCSCLRPRADLALLLKTSCAEAVIAAPCEFAPA